MKKKAFIGDMLTFGIILFSLAIVIVVMSYTWDAINDGWQNSTQIPQESKSIISTQQSRFVPVWDGFFVVAVIGYAIAIIILGFAIRSHPVFAMIGIIIMVIFGIVALHLSNAFDAFASTSDIAPTANNFSILPFVMNNLPIIIIALGMLFLVILFAKTKQQGAGF